MPIVHIRINDTATNQPTPVRLRITGPAGESYAPLGRSALFPIGRGEEVGSGLLLGKERWCATEGSFEVSLPAGVLLRLQAMKGPFYTPIDETFTLGPGQISKRFSIKRWHDPKSSHHYSADLHTEFITPHAAAREADAEDVDMVSVLAFDFPNAMLDGRTYHTTPNLEAFSGPSAYALPEREALVAVGTLNQHAVLGKLGILASHRVVHPLSFGPPDGTNDWSLIDWCEQAQRKSGVPVWLDPFTTTSSVNSGEGLIALLLGKLKTIAYDGSPRKQSLFPNYYRLLNAGFPVQLLGTSGKDHNRVPLGGLRTYVALDTSEPLSLLAWLKAFQKGPSLVTNGPWLTITQNHGSYIVEAKSHVKMDAVELVCDGVAIAKATPEHREGIWTAHIEHTPTKTGLWYAARCAGAASMLNPAWQLFAHTSPIHNRENSDYRRSEIDLAPFRRAIESTMQWIENVGHFEKPRHREAMLDQAQQALEKLS